VFLIPVSTPLVPEGHSEAYSTLPSAPTHFSNWPCAAKGTIIANNAMEDFKGYSPGSGRIPPAAC
jgi:hypothetical protein